MSVVIVCVVLLLGFVILPEIAKAKPKITYLSCVNNLKNIGLAYRIYATDNNGYPWQLPATNRPAAVSTNYSAMPGTALDPDHGAAAVLSIVSNELSALRIVVCPHDKRVALKTNTFAFLMAPAQAAVRDRTVSYFIGTSANEENPQSILSGDRNLAGAPFSTDTNTPPSQVALRVRHAAVTNQTSLNSVGWTKGIHQQAGNLVLGDGSVRQVSDGRMRAQLIDAALSSGTDLDFIWPAN